MSLIEEVKLRGNAKIAEGKQVDWTDQLLIGGIGRMEAGNAMMMSRKSIEQVQKYLEEYKFKWEGNHSNGNPVTPAEKKSKANEIAALLCKHNKWKDHVHTIDRNAAWSECKLKIVESESIDGSDKAMKRMWALLLSVYNTISTKAYVSSSYGIIRQLKPQTIEKK